MPIEPPPALTNVAAVPTPQNPPTLQDITNAINYVEDIKIDRWRQTLGCATAEDLAIAYTYRVAVISARAGEAVAPPWFNQAMRSALQPLEEKINRLDAKVGRLDARVGQLDAKIDQVQVELRQTAHTTNMHYNMQCRDGRLAPYKVIQFLDGTSPGDHNLPPLHTAQDIRNLNHLNVRAYMRGYGLPSHSQDHRRAVANAIGCAVDL